MREVYEIFKTNDLVVLLSCLKKKGQKCCVIM